MMYPSLRHRVRMIALMNKEKKRNKVQGRVQGLLEASKMSWKGLIPSTAISLL